MNLLLKQWLIYKHMCIPANATQAQIMETRRAFYAGASMLLDVQMTFSNDLRKMDSIVAEIRQFVADVKKGAA